MPKGTFIYNGEGIEELAKTIHAAHKEFGSGSMLLEFSDADGGMTTRQRGSLHVWLKEFAEVLNDAGIDQRLLFDSLKEGVEIPNTMYSMKALYKMILEAMEGKESTEEMDKPEPSKIAEILGKVITERVAHAAAVVPPHWPDRFNNGGRGL